MSNNKALEKIKKLAIDHYKKNESSYKFNEKDPQFKDFVNRDVTNFVLRKISIKSIVKECPEIMDYVIHADFFENRLVTGNTVVSEAVRQIVSKTLTAFDRNKTNQERSS